MELYNDTLICPGVDCSYSLWNEQQNRYVPSHPKRFYGMTLQQAYNLLVASLQTGSPLATLNPERCAYANVHLEEVEIPTDIKKYIEEHPGVSLNPASPIVQEALRLRMRKEKAAALADERE